MRKTGNTIPTYSSPVSRTKTPETIMVSGVSFIGLPLFRQVPSYCALIRGNSAAIIRRISPVSCRAGQRSRPETEQPDGLITNKPE